MATCGHSSKMRSPNKATASITGSQLSRISSALRSFKCASSPGPGSLEGTMRPSAEATALGTRRASRKGPRSTKQMGWNCFPNACAAARETVVFPIPPGPTTVTNRHSPSNTMMSCMACLRPTTRASCAGSFPSCGAEILVAAASGCPAGPVTGAMKQYPRPVTLRI